MPANWNNPYAWHVDDALEPTEAQAWLLSKQRMWAGQIDQDGNPIAPAVPSRDTRQGA